MAESKSDPSNTIPDKDVKAPNILQRTKEEIEAIMHNKKSHHHHKESHGIRDDIDENTPINDVKAPNVFERVQEEMEALVQSIHPKKEAKSHNSPSHETEKRAGTIKAESKPDQPNFVSPDSPVAEQDVKAPNLIERAKEELEAIMHKQKSPKHHHKETHGKSDDINENTPISEIKGPNVFERAKEEVEALVQTIHPKKDSHNVASSPKKDGFRASIRKGLEKVCSPRGHKRE
ncbi:hypothetical protein RHGRI_013003 [Rhododendron griersonianum]|uniref:Dehydrin n=1 Tax=Rhododendron griersonianum TaxID=479676 RepID=A0AAV6K463_9ERIC|nr:hypothetical protein RHGRI_013003 [Rhododendron griersonianum]